MHRRRWASLAVVCVSLMVISLDNTILNVAIPTLSRTLNAGTSSLQWIVDIYVLVFAGLLLTAGSLGDRFGRYKSLTFGLIIFGTGSVASALSGSTAVLIGTRAFMGIGGAFIMPATLSIITNVFTTPSERAKAIGIWAGVAALGVGIGPVTGGFLLDHFYWGSVFFVNVPIVALALIGGWFLVPESKDPSAPRLDPVGAVLSIAGLAAVLWAVIEAPVDGWGSLSVVIGLAAGVALLGAFVRWELSYSSPMLDMRFFKNARFTAASVAIALAFLALFGSMFVLTQYLQLDHGYSPLKAGALLIPMSVAMMVTAPSSAFVVERWGNKLVVGVGLLVVALGLSAFGWLGSGAALGEIVGATVIMGAGFGFVMAPATDSIMGSLPRAKAGVGSAMNDTTRQTGGAVGVAVLGSVLASKFRSSMTAGAKAAHIPSSLAHASRSGIAAALKVAHTPAGQPFAGALTSVGRHSFILAFHLAAVAGTVVIVVAAVSVFKWLPAWARDDVSLEAVAGAGGVGAVNGAGAGAGAFEVAEAGAVAQAAEVAEAGAVAPMATAFVAEGREASDGSVVVGAGILVGDSVVMPDGTG
ncbi:MAG: DHA2 family efflux MFS transporter permease subunit, partial [Acidimicrobiales bacterium]